MKKKENDSGLNDSGRRKNVVLFVQISNAQQKLITNNEYDPILSL